MARGDHPFEARTLAMLIRLGRTNSGELSTRQLAVLAAAASVLAGMTTADYARALGLSVCSISRSAGKLKRRGLITARRRADNARWVAIAATASGRRYLRTIALGSRP